MFSLSKSNKNKMIMKKKKVQCRSEIGHFRRQTGFMLSRSKVKFRQICCSQIRFSFCLRVVDLWNSLPSSVVEAKTVESFERRLDKLWREQPAYYNYNEAIKPTGYDKNIQSEEELIRAGPTGRNRPSTRRGFVSICEYDAYIQYLSERLILIDVTIPFVYKFRQIGNSRLSTIRMNTVVTGRFGRESFRPWSDSANFW